MKLRTEFVRIIHILRGKRFSLSWSFVPFFAKERKEGFVVSVKQLLVAAEHSPQDGHMVADVKMKVKTKGPAQVTFGGCD